MAYGNSSRARGRGTPPHRVPRGKRGRTRSSNRGTPPRTGGTSRPSRISRPNRPGGGLRGRRQWTPGGGPGGPPMIEKKRSHKRIRRS